MTATRRATHTRGFLFADLRDYSAYTDSHGDRAAEELLRRFRTLVRREIEAHAGAEIRTEGDSFYVVFDSVSNALEAGIAIRDAAAAASDEVPIKVGIGIHAGEVTDGDQGIVSSAVNIAARVCSVARPGEVLVTDTVRSLTRTLLAVTFAPRGRRKLKGIGEPIALFSVDDSGPAPRTAFSGPVPRWAAVGGAFVAGIALIITVALSVRGPAGGAGASPSDPSPAAGATVAEETHDLGRFTDPGEYPNNDELALLESLIPGATSNCERADPSIYPVRYFPATEDEPAFRLPLAIRAGITCLTGGNTATYLQVATPSFPKINTAEDMVSNLISRRRLEEGSCVERSRAFEEWTSGAHSGRVMCLIREGEAMLEWSYVQPNVYAIATRRDGDMVALYEWWEDTGRLLSR